MNNNSKKFIITRTVHAPLSLVWKAWSEQESLATWWGPAGFRMEVSAFEFRPGGKFHYSLTMGDHVMWGLFVYQDILEPRQMNYVSSFSDEKGNVERAAFDARFPLEIANKITFEEQEGKTLITLTGGPMDASEEEQQFYEGMFDSMQQGFGNTFDQLDAYLKNMPE